MSEGNGSHEFQNENDGIHSPFFATYADAAARTADTRTTGPRVLPGNPSSSFRALVTEDLNKIALQLDDSSIWLLTSTTPTWTNLFVGMASSSSEVDVLVRKASAGTLSVGDAVYVAGYDVGNSVITAELAQADSATTSPALGLVSELATDSTTGKVRVIGQLGGLDTSSFSAQDELYVSASVAGEVTTTRPTGPTAQIQKLAVVAYSHASNGVVNVKGGIRANALPNLTNGKTWQGNGSNLPVEVDFPASFSPLVWPAHRLRSTNSANWAVSGNAPLIVDPANTAILLRASDDTLEEGPGLFIDVPTGAVSMTVTTRTKARSAPGGAVVAKPLFYYRALGDNSAVASWSASQTLTDINLGANVFFQVDETTKTLATWGLTSGSRYQCQITRTSTGNTLSGDLCWESITVEFS